METTENNIVFNHGAEKLQHALRRKAARIKGRRRARLMREVAGTNMPESYLTKCYPNGCLHETCGWSKAQMATNGLAYRSVPVRKAMMAAMDAVKNLDVESADDSGI